MVGLLGINLPRVLTWVFGLGCAISGIAGVLAAPLWTITPAMATNAIMPAFVVVAIGDLLRGCRRLGRRHFLASTVAVPSVLLGK